MSIPEEKLQGLIFDCDGTLIDTMPAYWLSWMRTCRHFSLSFNEKRFYSFAGVPVRDIFKILISESNNLPKPDLDAVCELKHRYGQEAVVEVGTPSIDVVVEIAKRYHGKVPMAVASSGHRDHVLESLKLNGILELFDSIITCEDVTNPKPAPDIFLEAARRINCDPKFCRGFEDGEAGLQALAAAGMEVIDVRLMDGYPLVEPSDQDVLSLNSL